MFVLQIHYKKYVSDQCVFNEMGTMYYKYIYIHKE